MNKSDTFLETFRALLLAALLLSSPLSLAGEGPPAPVPASALEARVSELAHKLRCLVCENQSIAESNAPLAADLRERVREQFQAGKSEQEVIAWLSGRYGDYVLYDPPFKPITLLLWAGPALLLILGASGLLMRLRRRQREQLAQAPLSEADRARARALLQTPEPE
ncbi:cytochrome c biogenesis protein [Betaproteobacteria bacterium]|nr:cytochrome c biogenesis protein [Betaproteobacteria bacterium]GHU23526.1 cytochrome c biogenesis protein [Betaproteobacteria bacterium]GHU32263.1 cytochrome c biogenesis protein [Betaproteobacteria bacterium]